MGQEVHKGKADYAAKQIVCGTCVHNSNNWRCSLADKTFKGILPLENSCPIGKHPDGNGTAKYVGLSFNGVPMPLRLLHEREARRASQKPATPFILGCGCISSVKDWADRWKKRNGVRKAIAKTVEWVAPKLALAWSYAIEGYLYLRRTPQRIGNRLCRKYRVTKPSVNVLEEGTDNAKRILAQHPRSLQDFKQQRKSDIGSIGNLPRIESVKGTEQNGGRQSGSSRTCGKCQGR